MMVKDIIYQDGDFWFYYDKATESYVICKDGYVCSTIVGHASTYEQAKESVEWHKQMERDKKHLDIKNHPAV